MGKSTIARVRKLMDDKKAVFGLSSVQQFFAVILGLALLAYVIVVIMGTLSNSTILPSSTLSQTNINESSFINRSGDQLDSLNSILGLSNIVIIAAINGSNNTQPIAATNYTTSASGVISNITANEWNNVNITYSYYYNSAVTNNANAILSNTSAGITSFFSAINPVYAILAILVIILVLVVLVRVVSGSSGQRNQAPQL